MKQESNYETVLRRSLAFLCLLGLFLSGATSLTRASESATVEISGSIVKLPEAGGVVGEWIVGRSTVAVSATTRIEGTPAVGAFVEIEGTRQSGGKIGALKISVKYGAPTGTEARLSGRIESLPSTPGRIGLWTIAGRQVNVTDLTRIKQEAGVPVIGRSVTVTGREGADRVITATEIETQRDSSTSSEVDFTGQIEQIPDPIRPGEWTVSGRTITVTTQTRIKEENGRAMIGALVEIKGVLDSSGKVAASEIEVKRSSTPTPGVISFEGTIESLPAGGGTTGEWKVSGRTINVTATTRINREIGTIAIGAKVEVRGTIDAAGSVTATYIELSGESTSPGYLRFLGTIASIVPDSTAAGSSNLIGQWKIGERTIRVTATTKIDQEDGQAQVGSLVEVEATTLTDGSLEAKSIEVKRGSGVVSSYVRFTGLIEALPSGSSPIGLWTVAGRQVNVTTTTRIKQEDGQPVVGALVEVVGNAPTTSSSGTTSPLDALVIEVRKSTETATGSNGYIEFYGEIKSLPTPVDGKYLGEWSVGATNRRVIVDGLTRIETERAELKVGGYVEVKGYVGDSGVVKATRIETRPTTNSPGTLPEPSFVEFKGKVTALPETINYLGQWTIDASRKVNVTRSTRIKREGTRIEVGALVAVTGAELPNGEVDARYVEVSSSQSGGSFTTYNPFTSVNAGSYQSGNAASSIIAGFGANLAPAVAIATTLPLPTTLGGVAVLVDGRPAGLFYVSPTQINYQAPTQLLPGTALVTVLRDEKVVAQGTLTLDQAAPSIFTANGSGLGAPAGQLLRVKANGQLSYEPLARYDTAQAAIVPVTIVRQPGDKLFLVFYGTGLSEMEDGDGDASNGVAEHIEALLGDKPMKVLYTGRAPGFAGLDQINVELPETAVGTFEITIRVNDGDGKVLSANKVTITIN